MCVDTIRLTREAVGKWIESYSFKPDDEAEFALVTRILCEHWFDQFANDGILDINYKGIIIQAPLRLAPFPPDEIGEFIGPSTPLEVKDIDEQ